jgi:uncharacterized membrane protein
VASKPVTSVDLYIDEILLPLIKNKMIKFEKNAKRKCQKALVFVLFLEAFEEKFKYQNNMQSDLFYFLLRKQEMKGGKINKQGFLRLSIIGNSFIQITMPNKGSYTAMMILSTFLKKRVCRLGPQKFQNGLFKSLNILLILMIKMINVRYITLQNRIIPSSP